MLHPLLTFLCLAQIVEGSTNTTTSDCLQPAGDGTIRSVWSILGSCALTLLICVWQAIHPNIPPARRRWSQTLLGLVGLPLSVFLLPEFVVFIASGQWSVSRRIFKKFVGMFSLTMGAAGWSNRLWDDPADREYQYEWSKTHSFFADMGGFAYRDDHGLRTIKSDEFLDLCKRGEIANPAITVKEIKDSGKSDWLGKTIFAIQLLWFTLQVAVRHFSGLAVTLVELDTVCMAILTLLLVFFWWNKPLRADCPHVFYSKRYLQGDPDFKSSQAWRQKPNWLYFICCIRQRQSDTDEGKKAPVEIGCESAPLYYPEQRQRKSPLEQLKRMKLSDNITAIVSLCVTWFIFGVLHLAAWNFSFVTNLEERMWHIASLSLTASALACMVVAGFAVMLDILKMRNANTVEIGLLYLTLVCAFYSRVFLAALMLASLRSLPCSAYQTISWTAYIPHL